MGPTFLYGDSDTPPHLVAFYDTLGILRTHSRLDPRALTGLFFYINALIIAVAPHEINAYGRAYM